MEPPKQASGGDGGEAISLKTATGEASLLSQLDRHFTSCLDLCDALERVADTLPENIALCECLDLAGRLYPTVKKAHDFEENRLFPLLGEDGRQDGETRKTVDRLHCEHCEDESFAFEVQEALKEFVTGGKRANPEVLAYMLRGFFEGMRRHVAFEREHVVPAVLHKLTDQETH